MANETASTVSSIALSGMHSFTVPNHSAYKGSRRLHPQDSTFTVGRYEWEIAYYPNGDQKSGRNHVSVFLVHRNPCQREAVRASFTISLQDPAMSVEAAKKEFCHTFTPISLRAGASLYLRKDELVASGCLTDDSLVVKCVLRLAASRLTGDVIVPPSDLREHIGVLRYNNQRDADTTIRVADRTFKVHRCVLAARSPVFEAQLYGPMKDSGKATFRIKDVDAGVFQALLHFIYSDALPASMDGDDDLRKTKDLLVAANLYGMERLKVICEEKLGRGIGVETVVGMLLFAEDYYCGHLKASCIEYMLHRDRLGVIMEREEFNQLASNPSFMKEILRGVAAIL